MYTNNYSNSISTNSHAPLESRIKRVEEIRFIKYTVG